MRSIRYVVPLILCPFLGRRVKCLAFVFQGFVLLFWFWSAVIGVLDFDASLIVGSGHSEVLRWFVR